MLYYRRVSRTAIAMSGIEYSLSIVLLYNLIYHTQSQHSTVITISSGLRYHSAQQEPKHQDEASARRRRRGKGSQQASKDNLSPGCFVKSKEEVPGGVASNNVRYRAPQIPRYSFSYHRPLTASASPQYLTLLSRDRVPVSYHSTLYNEFRLISRNLTSQTPANPICQITTMFLQRGIAAFLYHIGDSLSLLKHWPVRRWRTLRLFGH